MNRWRRRRLFVTLGIVVVLLLAAGVTALFVLRERPSTTAKVYPDRSARVEIGGQIVVDVPVGAVDAPGEISVRQVDLGPLPRGLAMAAMFEVGLSSGVHQRAPMRVTLPLPDAAGGEPVWLAQTPDRQAWSGGPVSVDGPRRQIQAGVATLSMFGIGWLDRAALTVPLTELADRLRSGAPSVSTPSCPDADQIEKQGVVVEADAPAVRWCTGFSSGRLIVRLVGAAPYPLLVRYDDTATWLGRRGGNTVSWFSDRITALTVPELGGRAAIVVPGEEVELGIDRIWQGRTRFVISPDPLALLAQILDVATSMYATTAVDLARIGLVRPPVAATDPSAVAASMALDSACGPGVQAMAEAPDLTSSFADHLGPLIACVAEEAKRISRPAGEFAGGVVNTGLDQPGSVIRGATGDPATLVEGLRNGETGELTVTYPRLAAASQAARFSDGSPRHMLVIDVSGSMADDDGKGTVKIDGAKAAVVTTLDAMPASALVGLRTYPSPRDNCGSQMQSGLTSPGDRSLRSRVAGLQPDGGTPTAPALLAAVADLEQAGLTPDSTIILVSDGESNCGGDPCVAAREIAVRGVAVVNTVGFNVSEPGRSELKCISDATGGRYLDAGDAAGLRDAIAAAANPKLAVTIDAPKTGTGDMVPVVAAGEAVNLTVTVANVSARVVNRVAVLLSFPPAPDNVDPGAPGPVRSIGNLQPGEHRQLVWRYEAPAAEGGQSRFTVVAAAANAAPARVEGSIRYAGAVNLSLAGPILSKAKRVAILGDSFSSGEGAGGYATGDECYRSGDTYAARLLPSVVLACAGATAAAVAAGGGQAAALDALTDRPDLALLTLGGNDIGLADTLLYCTLVPSCQDSAVYPNPLLDASCLNRYQEAGAFEAAPAAVPTLAGCADFVVPFRMVAYARLVRLAHTLPASYRRVDAALNGRGDRPVAPIVVLAYPRVTPHYSENRGFCPGFDPAELRFVRELTDRLNATIAGAVEATRAHGIPIWFAEDVADALNANHTVCDPRPHANGPDPADTAPGVDARAYELMHPNRDGYLDMTAALVRWSARPEIAALVVERTGGERFQASGAGPRATGLELRKVPARYDGVPVGGLVEVSADGYAPNSRVTLWIQSAPAAIGTAVTDDAGRLRTEVVLPADLPPGTHVVVAMGPGAAEDPQWTYAVVDVVRVDPLARILLWAFGVALVLVALVLWWRRRRRQMGSHPETRNHAFTS